MKTRTIFLAAAAASALLGATPVTAQQKTAPVVDERWRAYLGCWSSYAGNVKGPNVCVVPTADANTVELLAIAGDSIVSTTPVSASGTRVPRTKDGCTGWEEGTWSADDRRLYTRAEYTCEGGSLQKSSAMYSFSPLGDFSRIEGVKTRSANAVRIITFRTLGDGLALPAAVTLRLPTMNVSQTYAARMELSADVTPADVADATQHLDAPLVEAWLADRGQPFELAANDLRALRDAKVPASVIDVMIAVSNPDVFSLVRGGRGAVVAEGAPRRASTQSGRDFELQRAMQRARYGSLGGDPRYFWVDDLFYPYFGYNSLYGYGYRNQYLYGGWLNSFGNCLGRFDCYSGPGWYNGYGPVVIIPSPTPTAPVRGGSVVNGGGYTQGSSSGGGRVAQPSGSVSSGGYSGGTSTSVGSGSGGSSPSPAASGGGQRTAKPRP